jgi:2-keto-3-deoxy-L-rhamnonate aldolase RhmA
MDVVRINKTKRRLAEGRRAIGAVLASAAPELVEIAAVAGCHFVTFDAEHEPLDDRQLAELIRAADAFDITPIVRVPRDPDRLLRLLDAGAQGVHVPRCSSADDMRALAEATRFHPDGKRTFYRLGRGGNYKRGFDDDEWARRANEELLVIAMIEEAEALPRLGEMLAVPGFDAVHIGPKDLWQSMGMPPDAEVQAAVGQIARAVAGAGKHVSLQLQSYDDIPAQLARHQALAATMISIPLLGLLLRETERVVDAIRTLSER